MVFAPSFPRISQPTLVIIHEPSQFYTQTTFFQHFGSHVQDIAWETLKSGLRKEYFISSWLNQLVQLSPPPFEKVGYLHILN